MTTCNRTSKYWSTHEAPPSVILALCLFSITVASASRWDADLAEFSVDGTDVGPQELGWAVSLVDLNSDGFDDMVISSRQDTTGGTGKVQIFFGPDDRSGNADDSDADITISGSSAGDLFGYALAYEDLDGDGDPDLAIGAPGVGGNDGAVYVYDNIMPGTSPLTWGITDADAVIEGVAGRRVGTSLAAGEISGTPVLFTGAPRTSGGRVFGFDTSSGLPSSQTTAAADWVFTGSAGEDAGEAVALSSDGNLYIGAPEYGSVNEGRVYQALALSFASTGTTALSTLTDHVTGDGVEELGKRLFSFKGVGSTGIDIVVAIAQEGSTASGDFVYFEDAKLTATLSTSVQQFASANSGVHRLKSATAADYLGLGYKQLLLGDSNARTNWSLSVSGTVYALGGNLTAPGLVGPTDALFTLYEPDAADAGQDFGASLATGDVNGDGAKDLLVGVPNDTFFGSTTENGRARLYYGPFIPIDDDFTASDAAFTIDGTASFDSAGYWVEGVGDVNCDGVDDIAVGAPLGPVGGQVGLFYGPTADSGPIEWFSTTSLSSANVLFQGGATGDKANAVGALGDVNGDGCDDFAIGAWMTDVGAANAGSVYLFHGSGSLPSALSTSNAAASFHHTASNARFGYTAIENTGDLNGDGFPELVISAPYEDVAGASEAGAVYVFDGQSSGFSVTYQPSSDADCIITGVAAADLTGLAVSGPLDFDGDGDQDLAIGVPGADFAGTYQDEGAVYVFLGYPCGSGSTIAVTGADVEIEGPHSPGAFGGSMAVAPDLDGSGHDELFIGAPNSHDYSGSVMWVPGASVPSPSILAPGLGFEICAENTMDDRFGWAVSVGQTTWTPNLPNGWDENGRVDLLVSTPYWNTSPAAPDNKGAAYLFDGAVLAAAATSPAACLSPGGLVATDAQATFKGDLDGDLFGYTSGFAGDLNQDGEDDIIFGAPGTGGSSYRGAAHIYLSSQQ